MTETLNVIDKKIEYLKLESDFIKILKNQGVIEDSRYVLDMERNTIKKNLLADIKHEIVDKKIELIDLINKKKVLNKTEFTLQELKEELNKIPEKYNNLPLHGIDLIKDLWEVLQKN